MENFRYVYRCKKTFIEIANIANLTLKFAKKKVLHCGKFKIRKPERILIFRNKRNQEMKNIFKNILVKTIFFNFKRCFLYSLKRTI